MAYWACAQLETNRTAVALHFLGLNGFEVYCPRLREQRRVHGRKIIATPPLFIGYAFVQIVAGWWSARWSPGVIRLVMDGDGPAHVSDDIISEIRSRERNGLVELAKPRGLAPGMRVKVLEGPLHDQIGMLAALRPHSLSANLHFALWLALGRRRKHRHNYRTLGRGIRVPSFPPPAS